MDQVEIDKWFDSVKRELETAYVARDELWQQSGFLGSEERWIRLRRPIAECIDKSGTFLDIGCANGYLIECVTKWCAEMGIGVDPWGLDISEKLVDLARRRLPQLVDRLFVGNAWTWIPPRRFDFVRTELDIVPEGLRQAFVKRLLTDFVQPDGRLLVAEYRSRNDPVGTLWVNEYISAWGLVADSYRSGFDIDGREKTRVSIILSDTNSVTLNL